MGNANLSVILANYNHAPYIGRALQALLAQSVRPREIIVVDDASTDNSVQVIGEIANREPSIQFQQNSKNLGPCASYMRGVSRAQGEYLFLAASDDYVLPGFIEKSLTLLDKYPHAGLSCAYRSTVDGRSGLITQNPSGWCAEPSYLNPEQLAAIPRLEGIAGHTTIAKKTSFDKAGGYLHDLKWHTDWFVNLVIGFREGICHIPETLALWTETSGSYVTLGLTQAAAHHEVLNRLFDHLLSPAYQDVLPFFQASGVVGALGSVVARVAARRKDSWQPEVLSLVGGLSLRQFAEVLDDASPEVRRLAAFFHAVLARQAPREKNLEAELAEAQRFVRWMGTSKLWKMREFTRRCKHAAVHWLKGRRAG